jgi:hypothetical protein
MLSLPAWPKEEPTNRMSILPQPNNLDPEVEAWSPSSGLQGSVLGDHSREIVELLARFANQEEQTQRA